MVISKTPVGTEMFLWKVSPFFDVAKMSHFVFSLKNIAIVPGAYPTMKTFRSLSPLPYTYKI